MRWSEEKDVVCNVITAVTDDVIADGRREWAKMGFLSRFIVFSYRFGLSQVNAILEEISDDGIDWE